MLTRSFNATFRYIDDVRSLNNSRFSDFVDRIYHIELEIKDTTYTDRYASYLDLHLEINSEGRLRPTIFLEMPVPSQVHYGHLRDIYSICRCCWNVARYK
jgi:hypothetical protein